MHLRTWGFKWWPVSKDTENEIRKRTPLEQAIAEKKDRRVRYDARMREKGYKRTSFWIPEDRIAEVKEFIEGLNPDPQ